MGILKRLFFGSDDAHLTPAERMVKLARADKDCRIYVEQASDGGIRFEIEPLTANTHGLSPRKDKQDKQQHQPQQHQNNGGFSGRPDRGRSGRPNGRPN